MRAGIRLRFAAEEIVGLFERFSKVVSERIVGKYNRGVVARCITIRVSRVRRLPTDPENGSSRRFYQKGGGVTEKLRFGAAFE